MSRRGALGVTLWLGLLALTILIAARAHYMADLSAFLPNSPTAMQRLLVDQLREGPASRLILMAVEGGDAAARAAAARATAGRLRVDARFTAVNDGDPAAAANDREFLFRHRYLLSAAVDAERFTAAGLGRAIGATLEDLSSPAGLLMKSLLPRDPTGEMLEIIGQLERTPGPRTADGVWVSPDGSRALLLAQTRAAGSDTDGQEQALAAVRRAFAAAVDGQPGASAGLRLRMSGPGVFAVAARATIKGEALRLSLQSSALIVLLLLAVYRSVPALLLGLLPVVSGALTGIAAVALCFGAVHGITLGFGITLIGESVDYSIYLFIQSRIRGARGADPDGTAAWRRLLWPTIRLGVLTSVCGFASLLPSGFPGLAQLGLYSITGLVTAALVTRFVLPELLPRGFVVRDAARLGAAAARLARSATFGPLAATLVLAGAAGVLIEHRATLWNRDLSALSPVPAAEQAFDGELRAELGTADVSDLVVVTAADLEGALQGAERAGAALSRLLDAGVIGGFDSPANYLPSLAAQEARRASLPPPAELRARLALATASLPLRDGLLAPFLADVEAARHAPLLTARDLQGTSLAAGFGALVLQQPNRWDALLPLHAAGAVPPDMARVRRALDAAAAGGAAILNLKGESDALYAGYLAEATRLSLAGFAAIVVLLLIALRSPSRVLKVLAPLVLAVLTVAAALALTGRQLTILHLIGMLLIVAVGSNYALFFDRRTDEGEGDALPLTLASLLIANAATVIGFGVLAFSRVPVLSALGETVAPGAFLALLFAALLWRPARRVAPVAG
jgi:predicted exporter